MSINKNGKDNNMNNRSSIRQNLRIGIFIILMSFMTWNLTASKPVTVALVYTVTTPELKADVVREIREQVGADAKLLTYEVPEAFEEIKRTGRVTALPTAQIIGCYMRAIEEGADVILSICSTVEDIAYWEIDGIPIIRVNEEMCREAVRKWKRLAIVSTFPTSLAPTRNTLEQVARELGKEVEITEVLVEGGFGMQADRLKALITEKIQKEAHNADVILFTQGSMAYCEPYIEEKLQKEVLTNPYFSAKAVREALVRKGLLPEE